MKGPGCERFQHGLQCGPCLFHSDAGLDCDLPLLQIHELDLVQQRQAHYALLAEGQAIGGQAGPHTPQLLTYGKEPSRIGTKLTGSTVRVIKGSSSWGRQSIH